MASKEPTNLEKSLAKKVLRRKLIREDLHKDGYQAMRGGLGLMQAITGFAARKGKEK